MIRNVMNTSRYKFFYLAKGLYNVYCILRDKDWKGMLSESLNCLKDC